MLPLQLNASSSREDFFRCVDQCGDRILIDSLETCEQGHLFDYFKFVYADENWTKNKYLAGRVHELVVWHLSGILAQENHGRVSEHAFEPYQNELIEALHVSSPVESDLEIKYLDLIQKEESYFDLFNDTNQFYNLFKQSPFVAGRLFTKVKARIKQCKGLRINEPLRLKHNLAENTIRKTEDIYFRLGKVYHIKADYSGFITYVEHRLREQDYRRLMEDFIEWKIPYDLVKLVLSGKREPSRSDQHDLGSSDSGPVALYAHSDSYEMISSVRNKLRDSETKYSFTFDRTITKKAFGDSIEKLKKELKTQLLKTDEQHSRSEASAASQVETPEELARYDDFEVFFGEFIEYFSSLINEKKYKNLLKTLCSMPLSIQLIQAVIDEDFLDEPNKESFKQTMRAYLGDDNRRKRLIFMELDEVIKNDNNLISPSTSPPTSISKRSSSGSSNSSLSEGTSSDEDNSR